MARSAMLNARIVERAFGVVAVGSALAMIGAAVLDIGAMVTAGAVLLAVAALSAAGLGYVEPWRKTTSTPGGLMQAWGRLRQFTPLQAIAYGWGAVTMQGLYFTPLTGLKWQHGWQYALAMALLAALSVGFLRGLWPPPVPGRDADAVARWVRLGLPLAVVQGLAACGLLAWLIVSGKLASERADWAANRVFAALALATVAISVATALAHSGARRRD